MDFVPVISIISTLKWDFNVLWKYSLVYLLQIIVPIRQISNKIKSVFLSEIDLPFQKIAFK